MRQKLSKLSIPMLVVFEALCRHRSTSLAADELGMTQPGVSQYLKQLREAFGDPLFVRVSKGLEPTDRSLALLEHVEGILNNAENLLEHNLEFFDPKKDTVEFTVGFPTFHNKLIVNILSYNLLKKFPLIKINLINVEFDDAVNAIEERKLDLYIGEASDMLPKSYCIELLEEKPYTVICSSKNKLFDKGTINKKDFISMPNIKVTTEIGVSTFDKNLKKLGLLQNDTLTLPDIESATEFIKKTDYIMMYDRILIKPFITGNNITMLEPEFEMPHNKLHQVWHSSKNEDPAHQWLRQYVRDNLK